MSKKTVSSSEVKATKDGRTQIFTQQVWALMGPRKQGWEEIKEDPPELKELASSNNQLSGPGTVVVNSENVFEFMKAVSLYLHSATQEEKNRVFKLLDSDQELNALDSFEHTSQVDHSEVAKDLQNDAVKAAGNVKKEATVIKKLKAAQKTVNETAAINTDPATNVNPGGNIALNGQDNPAKVEDITEASKAILPENPARIGTSIDEESLAQAIANQEGRNDEPA